MDYCIMLKLLILSICILYIAGHVPRAKVKERDHDHEHMEGDKIHVRHSGLENFTKGENRSGQNVFHNEEFVRNKQHLTQHLMDHGKIMYDLTNATDDQLDYHFFNVHDNDGNRKLDGLELLEAINHGLEEMYEDVEEDDELTPHEKNTEIEELKQEAYDSVDKVLREDDYNKDGYINLDEFLRSRHATALIREANEDYYPDRSQQGQGQAQVQAQAQQT